jgi:hypothetical protein
MRKSLSALLMIASTLTPSLADGRKPAPRPKKAAPKPLPVFEFLGQDSETPTTMTELNGRPCSGTVKMNCANIGLATIGGEHVFYLNMNYYRTLLYRVSARFEARSFLPLLAAFSEKYGKPAITTRKMQTRGGAVASGSVASWRFKGGTLELVEKDAVADAGQFLFLSKDNQPPPDKPIVDF